MKKILALVGSCLWRLGKLLRCFLFRTNWVSLVKVSQVKVSFLWVNYIGSIHIELTKLTNYSLFILLVFFMGKSIQSKL